MAYDLLNSSNAAAPSVPTPAPAPAPVAPTPIAASTTISPPITVAPAPAPESLSAKLRPHHGGVGPMAGTIIIVILLAFGGLYFWGQYLNERDKNTTLPLIPGDPPAAQS